MKSVAFFPAAMAGVLAFFLTGCDKPPAVETAPFQSAGTSPVEWTTHERSASFLAMRDGVRIAVDVFLPAGYEGEGEPATAFPVIFSYTPYHRTFLDPASGTVPLGLFEFFVSRGYAYVAADMRGTGASFGWNNIMDDEIRHDSKEIIDWIAAQEWSDGNVGMTGGSYVGWSQLASASMKPEALKAIIPIHAGWDSFLMRPGGIYSYAMMQTWTAMTYAINRNQMFGEFPLPPAPPVVDEDGDGELADEIPVDQDGDGWFDDDYPWPVDELNPPQYPDGTARQHHYYYKAVMEHHAHPDGAPGTYDADRVLQSQPFWDSPRLGDGLTAPDLSFAWLEDIAESGVAIYNYAGWWDAFTRSSLELYATLKSTNPSRVVVWPVYHQGISPAAAAGMGADHAAVNIFSEPYLNEQLRWYDRWLKGVDNGIDEEPSVLIYVMNGEGWRSEDTWPLEREQRTRFYLSEARVLGDRAPAAGSDDYTADFSHNSSWDPPFDATGISDINEVIGKPPFGAETFGRSRQQMFGIAETLPYRTEMDKQSLTYTTEPLTEDTEVTGHPIVHVWASSTADYGDFFFYLEDVDENGESVLVTDYYHRAGFATLVDNDEMIPNNPGIDVLPDLPWHGYREADYTDRVFADGAIVEVVTDLQPTSWVFKAGHRIRLSIATADWPVFELHPKLSPSNRPDGPDNIVPTITIHRGGERASYIELPIIPN